MFDLMAYSYKRGIGIITLNENRSVTGIVVIVFGREGGNNFKVITLNNNANTTVSQSDTKITITKSSDGIWMASMKVFYI